MTGICYHHLHIILLLAPIHYIHLWAIVLYLFPLTYYTHSIVICWTFICYIVHLSVHSTHLPSSHRDHLTHVQYIYIIYDILLPVHRLHSHYII